MAGEPVKPEVSVEERVERCREKQVHCTDKERFHTPSDG